MDKFSYRALFTIVFALGLAFVSGCTDKSGAYKILEQQGYTDIKIGSHSWFGCSDDDIYKTKFTAVSPIGRQTKGEICSGIFKGSTVRYK